MTVAAASASRRRPGRRSPARRSAAGSRAGEAVRPSSPRPASQPAQSSATHAVPGVYQVQSIIEWAPNTTTRQSMLSIPIRSGV